MKLLDLDLEAAETALVTVSEHVPPGVEIGRPRLAVGTSVGVSVYCDVPGVIVMWAVPPCACHVDQAVTTAAEGMTVTRWRDGHVIDLITEEG